MCFMSLLVTTIMKNGAQPTKLLGLFITLALVGCTPAPDEGAADRRDVPDDPANCDPPPSSLPKARHLALREMIAGKEMISAEPSSSHGSAQSFYQDGTWASIAVEIDITHRSGSWEISTDDHSRDQLCTIVSQQDGRAVSPPFRQCRLILPDYPRCEATLFLAEYPQSRVGVKFVELDARSPRARP